MSQLRTRAGLAQPTWWHVLPSPQSSGPGTAHQQASRSSQIPNEPPTPSTAGAGTLGSTAAESAAARAANAEEIEEQPTLGGSKGCLEPQKGTYRPWKLKTSTLK